MAVIVAQLFSLPGVSRQPVVSAQAPPATDQPPPLGPGAVPSDDVGIPQDGRRLGKFETLRYDRDENMPLLRAAGRARSDSSQPRQRLLQPEAWRWSLHG